MIIEEGKFYKTRDGGKVGPMAIYSMNPRYFCVLEDSAGRLWERNGERYQDHVVDLVEEYKDDTQLFKVGDILRYVGEVNKYGYYTVGKLYTVTKVRTNTQYEMTDNEGSGHHWCEATILANFERPSRIEIKPSSPVQSRKTLVPGVYGIVMIQEPTAETPKGSVTIRIDRSIRGATAEQLRDAIRVLGEVASFLEEEDK